MIYGFRGLQNGLRGILCGLQVLHPCLQCLPLSFRMMHKALQVLQIRLRVLHGGFESLQIGFIPGSKQRNTWWKDQIRAYRATVKIIREGETGIGGFKIGD